MMMINKRHLIKGALISIVFLGTGALLALKPSPTKPAQQKRSPAEHCIYNG
ncbi:hypothetical protein HK413_02720 [Mucilaginibacter sp. S1162]|uniref:Uncharacterized protein n=1 Tax=Mucilaginibacter humi TaxID=2732510 RepID=A0ABX1W195_9SPHI|nr:hypothetical protein [Mucilaginibacter humi]NNU33348.1 hypothetical protein [Mucilaginibacter humi]